MCMRNASTPRESSQQDIEMLPEVQEFQKENYMEKHSNNTQNLGDDEKWLIFERLFDVDDAGTQRICQQVKEAEIEMHKNAKDAYRCVLKHYAGDHPLTARIRQPSGGKKLKVKKRIDKMLNPNTQWFYMNISMMFVFLCLHHFDYVKDIGKSSA